MNRLLSLFLVFLLLMGTACGRESFPNSGETGEDSKETSTATATNSSTEAGSGVSTPEPQETEATQTEAPTPVASPTSPTSAEPWAADDFEAPVRSSLSKGEWLYFLRKTLDQKLGIYSASQHFIEAFGFEVASSAGSGEWQVDFNILSGYYEPGSRTMYGPWGKEAEAIRLIVLEREGQLSLMEFTMDFAETDIPGVVEAGLLAQYDFFVAQWDRAASKGVEAISSIRSPIAATPILTFPNGFQAPAQGQVVVDVDGDGQRETVTVAFREDNSILLTAGQAMGEAWYDSPEGTYLVDIDEADGRMEIALTDYGPSSDETTILYAMEEGKLAEVGVISGILFAGDGQGRITSHSRSWMGPFKTWVFSIEYELDGDGRVAMMPTRWYSSTVPLTLLREVPLYADANDDTPGRVMPAGTQVVMNLSDVSEWFHLSAPGDLQGWVRFKDEENLLLPDGTLVNQEEVFDGIVWAD